MTEYETIAREMKAATDGATSADAPAANEYEAIAREMKAAAESAAQRSLYRADAVNPDRYAKSLRLGETVGLHPDTVDANFADIDRQARLASHAKALEQSPALASWLADGVNANVSHDDIPALTRIGDIMARAPAGGLVKSAGMGMKGLGDLNRAAGEYITQGIEAVGLDGMGAALRQPRDIPWWANPTRILARPGRVLKDVAEGIEPPRERQTLATDIAGGVGQIAGQIAVALVNPGASLASLLGQGADQQADRADEKGATESEWAQAVLTGAAVTGLTEKIGLDALLKRVPPSIRNATARHFADLGIAGTAEATQEVVEGFLHNLTAKLIYDPDAELLDGLDRDAAAAGGAGAVARALVNVAVKGRQVVDRRRQAEADGEFMDALAEGTTGSKLAARAPDLFARFVAAQAEGTDIENVYVPGDKVVELYQSLGIEDPFALTDETDPIFGWRGDLKQQLAEAVATGGDVVIPLGDYAAHIAGTEAHQALKAHLRVRQDGLSLDEARRFQAEAGAELEQRAAELQRQWEADEAAAEPARRVHDDAFSQARGAGYTVDAAEKHAALFAARYATRAERMGGDAWTQYRRSNVTIAQELPDSLRRASVDELDMLLHALRKGEKVPTDRQRFGPSLAEFIARRGGVVDTGGELTAMDAHLWHRGKPGMPRLVRERSDGAGPALPGMIDTQAANEHVPDSVARAAWEAGYFPETQGLRPTPDHLFAAVRDELSGRPRFADRGFQDPREHLRQSLADLDEALHRLGIDPRKEKNNDRIKAALRAAEGGNYPSALRQNKSPVTVRGDEFGAVDHDGLWKAASAHLKSLQARRATVENPDMGAIGFSRRSVGKLMSAADPTKLALIARIEDIVHAGRKDGDAQPPTDPAETRSVKSYQPMATWVRFGGRDLTVRFFVREDTSGKWQHDLWHNEKAPPEGEAGGDGGGRAIPAEPRAEPEQSIASDAEHLNIAIAEVPPEFGQQAPDARGSIRFEAGRSIITLFRQRDLSTLLHETGHLWLEELRADAADANAPQQVRDDWAAVLAYLGVPDGGAIETAHHERFARTAEAYFMEGKAPSPALQGAFDRFKAWLVAIYRTVAKLNAPIDDDIRAVFDRLIATDAEIAQAEESQRARQLFASAEAAGMTDAEFASYAEAVRKSRDDARDTLLKKVMGDITRRRTEDWKREEAGVRAEVEHEINRRPDFAALHYLRTGKFLDGRRWDGMPSLKLSRAALVDMYGNEAVLDLMPKGVPPLVVREGGTHPDFVAEMFGFRGGDEMVKALLALEAEQRALKDGGDTRSVRHATIAAETDRRMRDRHGDMLNDGSIQEEALAAIHNDARAAVLATELRALSRTGPTVRHQGRPWRVGPPTPLEVVREWAARTIAGHTVRDGTAVGRHARAEAQAGRAVEAALLAGDHAEAYRQQERRMLNHALAMEAKRAAEEVDAAVTMLGKFARKKTIKGMDQAYLDQIHGLLERFDFRPTSHKEVGRRKSLWEWAQEQEAEGHEVKVPSELLNEAYRTHYGDMTVDELRGLADSVKNIAHLGRLKQTLADGKEQREFDAVVDEAEAQTEAMDRIQASEHRNPRGLDKFKAGFRSLDSSLIKMEQVFLWLDGGNPNGVFNRIAFRPIADAQAKEGDLQLAITAKVMQAFDKLTPEHRKSLEAEHRVPELGDRVFKRSELLAAALNMGNRSNLDKMLKGERWDEAGVRSALDRHLTKADWDLAQDIWDTVNELWPEIEAQEKRLSGLAPEKIAAKEVMTRHGVYRGGYYPVIYDPARSPDVAKNAARADVRLGEDMFSKPATAKGHTIERAEGYARPLLLTLDVLPSHLSKVIHRLAFEEPLMQAAKFLDDPRIRRIVAGDGNETLGVLGPEIHDQFLPWLQSIANDRTIDLRPVRWWEGFARTARSCATMVGLGLRISTVIAQTMGLSAGAEMIGPKAVWDGVKAYVSDHAASVLMVTEKSGEMRHRHNQMDRDLRDGLRALTGRTGMAAGAQRFAFAGIAWMDRHVSFSIWIGAYNKALADGMNEDEAIHSADQVVRLTQGAGGAKDLSAIQRGSEFQKLTTMFYSYFNVMYARQRDLGRAIKAAETGEDFAAILARSWWLMVFPAVAGDILTGKAPDDEKDESWLGWLLRRILTYPAMSIPIARDIVSSTTSGYGYQMSPASRAIDVFKGLFGQDLPDLANGEEPERLVKHTLEAGGYALNLPLGQVGTTVQYLWDLMDGDRPNDGPLDIARGLTYGPVRGR